MNLRKSAVAKATLLGVLVFFVSTTTAAEQGIEATAAESSAGHESAEHQFHRNHFGGFLGASTHADNNETSLTIGLEVARQFTPRWALAANVELLSGTFERDIVLGVGAVFYAVPRFGLVVVPGIEFAKRDVEEGGEVHQEDETEFLLRLGAGYGFPLGQASLGPAVFADVAGNRWTFVYGLSLVTGF